MIAIVGEPGVGKTYTIKLLKKSGYSILIADEFLKEQYLFNNDGYKIIKKYLGKEYVNNHSVDIIKLRNYALTNIDRLEKLVHPLLVNHLIVNKYDFVEIPILNSKHCNFIKLFQKGIIITDSQENIRRRIKMRNMSSSLYNVLKKRHNNNPSFNYIEVKSGDIKMIINNI